MIVSELIKQLEVIRDSKGDPVVLIPGYIDENFEALSDVRIAMVTERPSFHRIHRYRQARQVDTPDGDLLPAVLLAACA